MDEMTTPPEEEEIPGDAAENKEPDFSRRDFMTAAAILAGSTLLLLSRYRFPYEADGERPPIPPEFKRFILAEQSTTAPGESTIIALGAQCPDLSCALWWGRDQDFQFFESVEQITAAYVQDNRVELFWLD